MLRDTLLFWGVYLAFFFSSSVVLVDVLADAVRLGSRGRFGYQVRRRLTLGRREALFANPFNLFDLIVVSAGSGAELSRRIYRQDRVLLRPLARWCRALAWCGYIYLGVTLTLAALSVRVGFAAVAPALLAVHGAFWAAMAYLCRRAWAEVPGLPPKKWSFILEALLVPAYVINAAKRLCALVKVETPPLALAARSLARGDAQQPELLAYAVAGRLAELEYHARSEADLQGIRRLKACLPNS